MKKIYILTLVFLCSASFFKAQVVYTGKPMYNVDVKRGGVFIGSFKLELYPTVAWHHVRNFDSLVSVKFYDTTAFHRVIPGFVIQGGDPNSRSGPVTTWGYGQPSQPNVNAEFSPVKHLRGILSAARSSNINSATSQFFICVAAAANLNNTYSVYGKVTSGMNIVDTIVLASTNTNTVNRPNIKHEMFITAIGSNDTIPIAPLLTSPPDGTMSLNGNASVQVKWASVKGAVLYHLEVATDPSFLNVVKTASVTDLFYTLNTSVIDPFTKYYWRVTVNNGGNFGPPSDVWTFDTYSNPVGISTNTGATEKISIFPNPSLGKFTFSNVEPGSLLEVFDVTGKRISEKIINENTFTLDLEGKDKGIYSYKIISDNKEASQGKLILK